MREERLPLWPILSLSSLPSTDLGQRHETQRAAAVFGPQGQSSATALTWALPGLA